MEIFFLLFIFFYALALWCVGRHWQQKRTFVPNKKYLASKAILIPFRNEAEHLPKLLINLADIVPSCQEVVFIDDSSTDGSSAIVSDFIRKENLDDWVLLKSAGIGKKAALTTGVHYSQAEVILTTDADCVLPSDWIRRMTRPFHQSDIQLVAGPVMTVGDTGFFARFQQIEWSSILLVTNYLFSIGRPTMCSGANLAYRRSAFLAVNGFSGNEMYPSGDDEFLLKKIVQHFGVKTVLYLKDKEVLVVTKPAAKWSSFIQQRVRWAGKWRLHRSISHASSAALAFVLAIVQLGSVVLLFGTREQKLVFLIFWAGKIGVEKRILQEVLATFRINLSFYRYVASSFLHPIYVVLVGILAIPGKYSWKGRNNRFNL